MDASRIQFVSRGRPAPFFDARTLISSEHPWAGFGFEEAHSSLEPMGSHSWSKTTLCYCMAEQGSLRWRHRGVWHNDGVEPGIVSVIRRDVEIQAAVPSGSFPMMVLQLDRSRMQQFAPVEAGAIEEALSSVRVTRDLQLASLLGSMREEVRDGCRSGRLYGESTSIALLSYLASRYATPPRVTAGASGLSPVQMRTIANYVRDNLSGDLAVSDLGALVDMRATRFSRAFKAAFGTTPYRFVMAERVAEARILLTSGQLSASQVATDMGFASHSHFAKVFRQFTGVSPRQYTAGY